MSPDEATTLHADLDSFYASVEQRDDPSLRGRPVIVGGGVVLAASYEAKRFGVSTPMPERQARELCPDAVVVPPRFEAYTEASRCVMAAFDDTTPLVEPMSIDEAFLDVGGLRRLAGEPIEIAADLRRRVADDVGLAITVGVARTKFLAKVASGVAKPDGLLLVDPHAETEFLHPLPVRALWGVGAVTSARLQNRGIETVGDVAALDERHLIAMLGVASGRHLHALAHHRDPRRIETGRRRGSIGSQQALGRSRCTMPEVESLLSGIADRVTRRLRRAGRRGRTVTVRFRDHSFRRWTRARSLPHPTAMTAPIRDVAVATLLAERDRIDTDGLSLIGLSVGNLISAERAGEQMLLPFGPIDELDVAVDLVRDRFGTGVLTRASLIGRRSGLEVPKLPD